MRLEPDDELSANRQVVLILRLVLDQQTQLHHGELLDAEALSQGRFLTLNELTGAVGHWLDQQRSAPEKE